MRTTTYILLLIATLLAACSDNQSLEPSIGRAIQFCTDTNTRGTEIVTENLTAFKVTALYPDKSVYFKDVVFKKTDEGTIFTSEKDYYWPSNSTLTFYAIAPATTACTLDTRNTEITYETSTNIQEHEDLIVATETGNGIYNSSQSVKLTFKHLLAQIMVKAKQSGASKYKYLIRGIRFGGIKNKGTYNFKTGDWVLTGTSDYKDIETTYNTAIKPTNVSIMGNNEETAMLLPQTLTAWDPKKDGENNWNGAYIGVLIQIKDMKNEQFIYPPKETPENEGYEWVAIPITQKFEIGKKYIYTLDFKTQAGYVAPGVVKQGKYEPGVSVP